MPVKQPRSVVRPVAAKDLMHPVHEAECQLQVPALLGEARQVQEVADRKGVRPEVASLSAEGLESRTRGEGHH